MARITVFQKNRFSGSLPAILVFPFAYFWVSFLTLSPHLYVLFLVSCDSFQCFIL